MIILNLHLMKNLQKLIGKYYIKQQHARQWELIRKCIRHLLCHGVKLIHPVAGFSSFTKYFRAIRRGFSVVLTVAGKSYHTPSSSPRQGRKEKRKIHIDVHVLYW